MWEKVAGGDGTSGLQDAGQYDDQLVEGQRGKLSLVLRFPMTPFLIEELQNKLESAGVVGAEVQATTPGLEITYRKGFPFLAVIAAAVIGLIVLAVLIISWTFFREVQDVVPKPLIIAGVVVVIALVAVVVLVVVRTQLPVGGVE